MLQPARIVGQTLPLEQASEVLDAMDSYETLGFSVDDVMASATKNEYRIQVMIQAIVASRFFLTE